MFRLPDIPLSTTSDGMNHLDLPPNVEKLSEEKKVGGWAEVEKEMILDALRESGGNRSKAAEILGWGRTTLWRKLNKYELN